MIRIYHVGAWGRNHGDRAIQVAMQDLITSVAARELNEVAHIYPIDIQSGPFTQHIEEVRDKADLLIVGGGGLLWDKPELRSRSGWQWDITLEEFDALEGVPTVLYGLGFTRFPYGDTTGKDGRMAEHLNGLVDRGVVVTVRNKGTRDAVRKLTGLDLGIVPDPAIFVTGMAMPDWSDSDVAIGLCWASDKPDWRWPSNAHQLNMLAAVAQQPYQLVLVEHIAEMDADLRDTLRRLHPAMTSVEATYPELYPANRANVRRLVGLYRNCDVVLSMRKHGLLIAMAQGVPAIGIGDMPEVGWFCQQYGLPWFPSAGNTTPKTLNRAIENALDNDWREAHRKHKRKLIEQERIWAKAFIEGALRRARSAAKGDRPKVRAT